MNEREVLVDDELLNTKVKLENLLMDLSQFEQDISPKQGEIVELQKAVKQLLDKDIMRRLQDGQSVIDQLD